MSEPTVIERMANASVLWGSGVELNALTDDVRDRVISNMVAAVSELQSIAATPGPMDATHMTRLWIGAVLKEHNEAELEKLRRSEGEGGKFNVS